MSGLPSGAVVSFWIHPYDMSPTKFACSGVFVGSRRILTVSHVFQDHPQLWVRPQGDMGQAFQITSAPIRHPDLDAALVEIETMPPDCVAAQLDKDDALPSNGDNTFLLNGFFDGKYELPHSSDWLAYEADDRMHRMSTRQPKGHSGSGLSRGSWLWGMAISHYSDPSIHRGCALSINQLWSGWLENYVSLPASGRGDRQYDAGWYESKIQEEVGNGRLEEARKLMLLLVENFPTTKDKQDAAQISYHLSEFEDYRKSSRPLKSAERKERSQWIGAMMELASRIVDRLSLEL